jgi:hypothetical protein
MELKAAPTKELHVSRVPAEPSNWKAELPLTWIKKASLERSLPPPSLHAFAKEPQSLTKVPGRKFGSSGGQ